MNDRTREILFGENREENALSIPLFDLDMKSVETGTYESRFNTLEDRIEAYLISKYSKEGYEIYKPSSGRLLLKKDGVYNLIYFILDSESEREEWNARKYMKDYSVFILRDRYVKERKGITSLSLDDAFGSFNFSTR